MRRNIVLTLTIAVMMALAVPAGASPPTGVHIEVETSFGGPSPFVASGQAVDDGLVCAEGMVDDASGKVAGFSPNGFNFQGVKHFICDDGSGEFFVKLQARIYFSEQPVKFNWNVVGGTGDYEDLHGAGSGVGLPLCGDDCVFDIYDGGLHIDP